jgi:hypothetical protein
MLHDSLSLTSDVGPPKLIQTIRRARETAGWRCPYLHLATILLCIVSVTGNTSIYSSHLHSFPYSPSTYPYSSVRSRSRRSRLHSSQDFAVAALVARKKKKIIIEETPTENLPQFPDVSFDDLGPVGKAVAGVTQVAVTTLMEYCSGFFAGLVLGTVVGLPVFLFKPLEPGVSNLLRTEMTGRFVRMNTKSLLWGRSWGGISAAFGGFKVAVTVVRNGKQDDWNQILSSAAAGAFFARTGKYIPIVLFSLKFRFAAF